MSDHDAEPRFPEPQVAIGFNFEQIFADLDGNEPDLDREFWGLIGQLFRDVLAWQTEAKTPESVGCRTLLLALYLNPTLISQSSMRQISRLPHAMSCAALSKALATFQEKFDLKHRTPVQKNEWQRERAGRSAIVAHQHRGLRCRAPRIEGESQAADGANATTACDGVAEKIHKPMLAQSKGRSQVRLPVPPTE